MGKGKFQNIVIKFGIRDLIWTWGFSVSINEFRGDATQTHRYILDLAEKLDKWRGFMDFKKVIRAILTPFRKRVIYLGYEPQFYDPLKQFNQIFKNP